MDTMNRFRSLIWSAALTVAVLFTASPLFAQTALTTTTLGAAIDNVQQSLTVASATGITAQGTGATFQYLLVDREILSVRGLPGGSTTVTVTRGQNGTRATAHISGASVTVIPALNNPQFVNYVPSGQCTRSQLTYVPLVVGGSVVQGANGSTYDCLGVTTAGQWVQTNDNGTPVLGTTMASTAGTLGLFTGTYLKVSGTNAITGFTNPAGIQPGFTVYLEATGVWTWTAAGNILTAGTTTAAGRVFIFVWNGTKWAPVQIA
jgi:hypothetical protein